MKGFTMFEKQICYPYLKKSVIMRSGKLRSLQGVCFYHEPWGTDVVVNVMVMQFYPKRKPTITILPRLFPSTSVQVLNKDKGSYEYVTVKEEEKIISLYGHSAIEVVRQGVENALKESFPVYDIKDIRLQYLIGQHENFVRGVMPVLNCVSPAAFAIDLGILVRNKQLDRRVKIVQEIERYGSEGLKEAYMQGLSTSFKPIFSTLDSNSLQVSCKKQGV